MKPIVTLRPPKRETAGCAGSEFVDALAKNRNAVDNRRCRKRGLFGGAVGLIRVVAELRPGFARFRQGEGKDGHFAPLKADPQLKTVG